MLIILGIYNENIKYDKVIKYVDPTSKNRILRDDFVVEIDKNRKKLKKEMKYKT